MTSNNTTKIAILGAGTVGGAFYHVIESRKLLPEYTIAKVVVQDVTKPRFAEVSGTQVKLDIPPGVLTTDAASVINDPKIGIIIDATAADTSTLLEEAMTNSKHVISANKAMIAKHGASLLAKAKAWGVHFLMEASVMGKTPVLQAAVGLQALGPWRFDGVVNGTCGYILTERHLNPHVNEDEVLKVAQQKGYAEADPTADVEAFDAASKIKILAKVFLGANCLSPEADPNILRIGIRDIPGHTFRFAEAHGFRVALVGTGILHDEKVTALVMPTLVDTKTFLGALRGVENGVVIQDRLGPALCLEGPGAGGEATAAALVQDLARLRAKKDVATELPIPERLLRSPDEIRFRPVFASRSLQSRHSVFCDKLQVLADEGLSVEQVHNETASTTDACTCDIIVCEEANFATVQRALKRLQALPCVVGPVKLLRVLGTKPVGLE